LLPCHRPDDPCRDDEPDFRKCVPCQHRPAVAAALAKAAGDGAVCMTNKQRANVESYVRRVQLAIAGYERQENVSTWVVKEHLKESIELIKALANSEDAAVVQGLEIAREIALNYNAETQFSLRRYSPEEIANAIAAEIAARKENT